MKYAELLELMKSHNEKIEEQFGEVLSEDESTEKDIDESLEWWVNHLIVKAKEQKSNSLAAKDLANHYSERAKNFESKEEYYKQGIYSLVNMNGSPIKSVAGTARIQEGVLGVTVNCPSELLPDEYKKVTYSADKTKIKKDLEGGKELNYAVLERGKPFLVIR